MKIEILDAAEKDLINGFKFYEGQNRGLGDYYVDSVFSDITACSQKDFPSPYIIEPKKRLSGYMPYWIAAGILFGPVIGLPNPC